MPGKGNWFVTKTQKFLVIAESKEEAIERAPYAAIHVWEAEWAAVPHYSGVIAEEGEIT